MKKQNQAVAALIAASVIILTACGGDGNGDSGVTPTPTSTATVTPTTTVTPTPTSTVTPTPTVLSGLQTGHFLDAAVEGLRYKTATQSGTTSKTGDFKFMPGETVTFYLYGTELNTSAASLVLTPADATTPDVDYTVNLLRLLQVLDTDADPSNGITLPEIGGLASIWTVQLDLHKNMYEFFDDPDVLGLVFGYGNGHLPSIKEAIAHFNDTLENVDDTVILDVTGKVLHHTEKDNICSNQDTAYSKYTYTFNAEGTGYVSNNTQYFSYGGDSSGMSVGGVACSLTTANTFKQYKFATTTNVMNTFFGGPKFTYKTMNRIGIRSTSVTPSNGLEAIVMIWHTPGTKEIHYIRRYIETPGSTSTSPLSTQRWDYWWD